MVYTEVTLKLASNMVGDYNGETNFQYKLLLIIKGIWKLCKAFANVSSANIKLSKIQLSKIVQSGGFLGRLLGLLLISGLFFIGYVLKQLAKSVSIALWLMTAASATDAAIHQTIFRSCMTTLIISNKEMNNIMKIVKSREESGLLLKGVNEAIIKEAKEHKGDFSVDFVRYIRCYLIRKYINR